MPYRSATGFIEEKGLCKTVGETSGIYAIVCDNRVLYVGKAVNMKRRTRMHFRIALNVPRRHKYVLLKQAINRNRKIDCVALKECDVSELYEQEKYYIDFYKSRKKDCPPLNNLREEDSNSLPYKIFIKKLNTYARLR